jgi:hypothetical protein
MSRAPPRGAAGPGPDDHKFIVASMVSRRPGRMLAELMWSPFRDQGWHQPRTTGPRRFPDVDRGPSPAIVPWPDPPDTGPDHRGLAPRCGRGSGSRSCLLPGCCPRGWYRQQRWPRASQAHRGFDGQAASRAGRAPLAGPVCHKPHSARLPALNWPDGGGFIRDVLPGSQATTIDMPNGPSRTWLVNAGCCDSWAASPG